MKRERYLYTHYFGSDRNFSGVLVVVGTYVTDYNEYQRPVLQKTEQFYPETD